MIYHGKFHKIPIEMDDDWGYPNFRKPPREGRNRRHGQPFSSHGHAGQENCENCEPPLKKVKESKPELIGERAWKSYFDYDNAKRIHGFKNDLRAGSIRDMTRTSVNLVFFHGCPWFSTHQNHVWSPIPQDSHAHAAVQTAGQQDVEATGSLGSPHRGGGAVADVWRDTRSHRYSMVQYGLIWYNDL